MLLPEELNKRNQKIIEKKGLPEQMLQLTEECAELIKEASKTLRGLERPTKLKEELVDVIVMVEEIRLMTGISWAEVNEMAAKKLTEALMKDGGEP